MEKLRPNEQRAKNAIILIWIVFGLDIISLISEYFQYKLLQVVTNGGSISHEVANANDRRVQIISITYMIAFIISGIVFIQWFRRAYFNLHQKVTYLLQAEGWAAGSWFVPIICLFRPYQIMKELYEETEKLLIKKGIEMAEQLSSGSLALWWTLWIISSFYGQFVLRSTLGAKTIDQLITNTEYHMISHIIGIPLAIITVKVIFDYSKVEPLLNEIKDDEETTTVNNFLPPEDQPTSQDISTSI